MSCPICNRTPDTKFRPFCSKRCADVDLAKWMNGAYAIPSDDPEDTEEAVRAHIDWLDQIETDKERPQ